MTSDLFATEAEVPKNEQQERFIALLRSTGRDGIENLLAWLVGSDFYTAPASTRFHGAKESGLVEHLLAVESGIEIVCEAFNLNIDIASRRLVALLHDICKVNLYTVDYRNAKDPIIDGKQMTGWHKVPYYAINDQYPFGHGEKSVDIIRDFIELTPEERMAIRWHMGGFDDAARQYGGAMSLSAAMGKYPLICALHMADLAASWLEGK